VLQKWRGRGRVIRVRVLLEVDSLACGSGRVCKAQNSSQFIYFLPNRLMKKYICEL
jgi:hypothetical protein